MKCPFVVGQRVVCIHNGFVDTLGCGARLNLKVGEIYKIKDIYAKYSNVFLILDGVIGGWLFQRFRPLQQRPKETNIDVFLRMQTPTKVTEDA